MNLQRLEGILEDIKDLRVVVIGDVMLDRYLRGSAHRRSPEADVAILDHETTSTKLGGAANVAVNYRSLVSAVSLLSVCGNDAAADECRNLLDVADIRHFLVAEERRPTTVKTRIINKEKHLLRVDFESTDEVSSATVDNLIVRLEELIESDEPHLIVVQDYNKGLLTKDFIHAIIKKARRKNIYVAVDPKVTNFWEYKGVSFFKPNLRETSIALQRVLENDQDYKEAAKMLHEELSAEMIALTLSEKGILIFDGERQSHNAVLPVKIVDVCGAGDAVLVITSLMAYLGYSLDEIGYMGNLIGAQVCQISGVGLIDKTALTRLINETC